MRSALRAAVYNKRLFSRREILIAAGASLLAVACGSDLWNEAFPLSMYEVTHGGWQPYTRNPVIGGRSGSAFDVCVLREDDHYVMWVSWRPQSSIVRTVSADGIHWSPPSIALAPQPSSGWEDAVNRPSVLKRANEYHMWYSGQTAQASAIGYAVSTDGRRWERRVSMPVLLPTLPWEGQAVMCPHVLWDEQQQLYRMWYSAGSQYEPNAIGYATSKDGIAWTKYGDTPIFSPNTRDTWDGNRVTACQVIPLEGRYIMFYVGFSDINHAAIGMARSPDGITRWVRSPANPIIAPAPNPSAWTHDAVYKPFAVLSGDRWLLWYNARRDHSEQIGLAIHQGVDLGA